MSTIDASFDAGVDSDQATDIEVDVEADVEAEMQAGVEVEPNAVGTEPSARRPFVEPTADDHVEPPTAAPAFVDGND